MSTEQYEEVIAFYKARQEANDRRFARYMVDFDRYNKTIREDKSRIELLEKQIQQDKITLAIKESIIEKYEALLAKAITKNYED